MSIIKYNKKGKAMIIIRFQGGLGNQLFEYALYKELENAGIDVRADLTAYLSKQDDREYQLEEVFGIQLKCASKKEIFRIAGGERNIWGKCIRKFVKAGHIYNEKRSQNVNMFSQKDDIYLNGYWQSSRWFPSVENKLKETLHFRNVSDVLKERCNVIAEENSVSVHVRMGDYLQAEWLYGGICTKEYYQNAVEYMRKHVDNVIFYVFSDETEKAKDLLSEIIPEAYYIQATKKDSEELLLMSCCRHNILANSSFSWWGAWLNQYPEKVVIAPTKWNNDDQPRDIYQESWIKI